MRDLRGRERQRDLGDCRREVLQHRIDAGVQLAAPGAHALGRRVAHDLALGANQQLDVVGQLAAPVPGHGVVERRAHARRLCLVEIDVAVEPAISERAGLRIAELEQAAAAGEREQQRER